MQDGDRFWRMAEAYVRGNTIKYLRVPDEVLDKAKDADFKRDGGCMPGPTHAQCCTATHAGRRYHKQAGLGSWPRGCCSDLSG